MKGKYFIINYHQMNACYLLSNRYEYSIINCYQKDINILSNSVSNRNVHFVIFYYQMEEHI